MVIASIETCKFQQKQHMQVSTETRISAVITNSSTAYYFCWNMQVSTEVISSATIIYGFFLDNRSSGSQTKCYITVDSSESTISYIILSVL